ncbi:hypothetical protein SISNIDRAFT_450962 [Sistotremastrum niveocremeum HHB9708]|uniref:Chromo domain-containing protein n=1 Tax=Sistotremastrum niveocremeum HHB9708 TaxID=1314777 RepID=A0A164XUF6_9AGAM|nr:hypothetical protein SISNIDRAFT_450962 [Sistotremastrum niveocremeum HHB9708]
MNGGSSSSVQDTTPLVNTSNPSHRPGQIASFARNAVGVPTIVRTPPYALQYIPVAVPNAHAYIPPGVTQQRTESELSDKMEALLTRCFNNLNETLGRKIDTLAQRIETIEALHEASRVAREHDVDRDRVRKIDIDSRLGLVEALLKNVANAASPPSPSQSTIVASSESPAGGLSYTPPSLDIPPVVTEDQTPTPSQSAPQGLITFLQSKPWDETAERSVLPKIYDHIKTYYSPDPSQSASQISTPDNRNSLKRKRSDLTQTEPEPPMSPLTPLPPTPDRPANPRVIQLNPERPTTPTAARRSHRDRQAASTAAAVVPTPTPSPKKPRTTAPSVSHPRIGEVATRKPKASKPRKHTNPAGATSADLLEVVKIRQDLIAKIEKQTPNLVWPKALQEEETKLLINCDVCQFWYHFGCVGLDGRLDRNGEDFVCPPCSKNIYMDTRIRVKNTHKIVKCMMPSCTNITTEEEFFIEKVIAMKVVSSQGEIAKHPWLVKWQSYGLEEATWEPSSNIHDDYINAFQDEVKLSGVQVDGFNVIFLPEARRLFKNSPNG